MLQWPLLHFPQMWILVLYEEGKERAFCLALLNVWTLMPTHLLQAIVDYRVFSMARKRVETFNDLTSDVKTGSNW